MVGLTRTLAHEVGPSGISVNLISPWLVEGDRLGDVLVSMSKERGLTPDELRAEMTEGTAFKRTVSRSGRRRDRALPLLVRPPTT